MRFSVDKNKSKSVLEINKDLEYELKALVWKFRACRTEQGIVCPVNATNPLSG